jgi:thymidine kinase
MVNHHGERGAIKGFHVIHTTSGGSTTSVRLRFMFVMATLRFSYGTMGSGKSTLALQIHHNMSSRGVIGLLLTKLDRDGSQVTSRLGVSAPAIDVSLDLDLFELTKGHMPLQFLVCDETQFYSVEQCDQLARVVDELNVDVFAFGLITDFRGLLFDGTRRLLEIADQRIEMQVEARCWCGDRANNNARLVNGVIVYEGETVVVGDTDRTMSEPLFGDEVRYELLCRKHYINGVLGPSQ